MLSALKWVYFGAWWQSGLSLLTILALTWFLPPEIFGMNAAIWVVLGFADVLIGGTLHEGLYTVEDPKEDHFNTAFATLLGVALVYMGPVVAFNGPIAGFFALPDMAPPLAFSTLLLPLAAASTVLEACYARSLDMKVPVVATSVGTVIGNLVALVMAWQGFGIWSLVVMPVVAAAIRTLILLAGSDWLPKPVFTMARFREIGGFGTTLAGIRLLKMAERALVRMVILASAGPAVLGQFSLAWRLYEQLASLLKAPLGKIAVPAFSKFRNTPRELPPLLKSADIVISTIIAPAFLGLAVTAPALLPLVLDSDWAGSTLMFQFLCLMGFRRAVGAWHFPLLRGFGRPEQQLWITLAGFLFIAVAIQFAASHSAAAVVLVLVIRSFAELPVTAVVVRLATDYRLRDQARAAVPALVASLVMAAAVYSVWTVGLESRPGWPNLLLLVAVGVVTYLAAAFLLHPQRTRRLTAFALAFLRGETARSDTLFREL